MGRRPARCYSKIDRPPYVRKKYIKGGPDSKIKIFDMGAPQKEFPITVSLYGNADRQVSMNALEAARIAVNRYLSDKLDRSRWSFKVCVFPHHIIRENKILTGAGADRVSDGMRLAFGRPMGKAARVKKNQKLLMIRIDTENFSIAKEALRRAKFKFPMSAYINVDKGEELLKL
ncbi:MAG: 50S ribosomal protein L16 [Candidatus Hodarchaeales archaeon]|jgi:large subunit ribosomal protein L10e